jgi:hypothetical protein
MEHREKAHATHRSPGAVGWADAAPGGANGVGAELNLLEAVNGDVEVEVDGATVRDEDTVVDVLETLLLDSLEL